MPIGTSFRVLMGAGAGDNSAWTVIDSVTLGTAASSIVFDTGLTDYTFFRVTAYIVKDGSGGFPRLRINNDTGSNYNGQYLNGDATGVNAARSSGSFIDLLVRTQLAANQSATLDITIAKQLAGAAGMVVASATGPSGSGICLEDTAGRWNNTSALINRIDLISSSGNFAAGTTIYLEAS